LQGCRSSVGFFLGMPHRRELRKNDMLHVHAKRRMSTNAITAHMVVKEQN